MKMVVGNWKMNGRQEDIEELKRLCLLPEPPNADLVVCPPWTLMMPFRNWLADAEITRVVIGAQDCHTEPTHGAFTGDVSAEMLADAGIRHVIVGHSERRATHGETDAIVKAKANAVCGRALTAVLCIGETLEARQAGDTVDVLARQLAGSMPDHADPDYLVIAYEPIWAIGSGLTPTAGQIEDCAKAIHGAVGRDFRVLYGGSVKPDNAEALMAIPGVAGVLVGGASLKALDFHAIAMAAG